MPDDAVPNIEPATGRPRALPATGSIETIAAIAPFIDRLKAGEDYYDLWQEAARGIDPRRHWLARDSLFRARDRLARDLAANYLTRLSAGECYFDLSDELHANMRPDCLSVADLVLRAAAQRRAKAEHGPNSGAAKRIIQHNCPAQYFDKKLTAGDDYERRRREGLTRDILLAKWDAQGRRCALSKLPMKLDARPSSNPYNASIDQILPRSKGGTYDPKNVRLVLDGVNKMRSNFGDADLAAICRAVHETLASQT